MKHPEPETWMAYLYEDGLSQKERAELDAHLATCGDCRDRVESWNRVRRSLDTWKKLSPPRRVVPLPVVRWAPLAAAAAVLLAAGLALGRYTVPRTPDLEATRAVLRQELQAEWGEQLAQRLAQNQEAERAELRRLLTDYAVLQDRRRQEDLATVYGALQQVDTRQRKDATELRRDLETVAVLTDATFRQTQDQMVQLAASRPPGVGSGAGVLPNDSVTEPSEP